MKPVRELLYLSFHQHNKLNDLKNGNFVFIKIYADEIIKTYLVRPFYNDEPIRCQRLLCRCNNSLKVLVCSGNNFVTPKYYHEMFFLDPKNYLGVVVSDKCNIKDSLK